MSPVFQKPESRHPAPHPVHLPWNRANEPKNETSDADIVRQVARKPRVDPPDKPQSAIGPLYVSRFVTRETLNERKKFPIIPTKPEPAVILPASGSDCLVKPIDPDRNLHKNP